MSLREKMPQVTALIDDLRAAFGRLEVDRIIARGIRGEADAFHAREGGEVVGTAWTWGRGVSVEQMKNGKEERAP